MPHSKSEESVLRAEELEREDHFQAKKESSLWRSVQLCFGRSPLHIVEQDLIMEVGFELCSGNYVDYISLSNVLDSLSGYAFITPALL